MKLILACKDMHYCTVGFQTFIVNACIDKSIVFDTLLGQSLPCTRVRENMSSKPAGVGVASRTRFKAMSAVQRSVYSELCKVNLFYNKISRYHPTPLKHAL